MTVSAESSPDLDGKEHCIGENAVVHREQLVVSGRHGPPNSLVVCQRNVFCAETVIAYRLSTGTRGHDGLWLAS
jgi:hypothetical protein